jgi:hypothetical protein
MGLTAFTLVQPITYLDAVRPAVLVLGPRAHRRARRVRAVLAARKGPRNLSQLSLSSDADSHPKSYRSLLMKRRTTCVAQLGGWLGAHTRTHRRHWVCVCFSRVLWVSPSPEERGTLL